MLVERTVAGEAEAEDELVERMKFVRGLLVRRNQRFGHRFDPHAIDDLVQESLVRTWAQLTRYRGEAPLESWVARIAKATMADAARRLHYAPELNNEATLDLSVSDPDFELTPRLGPERLVLSPHEAEVVWLHVVESMTLVSIGARLRISQHIARARWRSAIRRLRRQMLRRPSERSAVARMAEASIVIYEPSAQLVGINVHQQS